MTRPPSTRLRDESGYAAILVALLSSVLFLGMAAMGVDTARWYVEVERVQKAADAAALAGVTYMPNDFDKAKTTALATAAKNGYDDASADVAVTVAVGSKPSELLVTISSRVRNAFGSGFGINNSWMTRSATADYTAPAPMGSPCNVFGNEAPPGRQGPAPTFALPDPAATNCFADPTSKLARPNFWAAIEGPETDKLQGDRYQALKCSESGNAGATYGCASSKNTEYKEQGYYFAVHVEPAAVGTTIDVQVYDPSFVPAGLTCTSNPTSGLSNNMNDWVSDGLTRYGSYSTTNTTSAVRQFCPGDLFPGGSTTARATNTTFVMRGKTETNNPDNAQPLVACPPKQFRGFTGAPSAGALTKGSSSYNDQLAQVYHQWVSVCSFTPTEEGDYYLQVRSNVSLGGSSSANTNSLNPVIYTGNSAADDDEGNTEQGAGANAFAVRAVPSSTSMRDDIAVSAWERMPILQIAASPATFNLVRALPNAKGQYLTFDFFDASDGSTGSVKVLPPADATGDVKATTGIPGCKVGKNDAAPSAYTSLTGCQYSLNGSVTDGQLIHMVIPIPNNYSCNNAILTGCWFQVRLTFDTNNVTDFTTWSANIGGDPVRLIK